MILMGNHLKIEAVHLLEFLLMERKLLLALYVMMVTQTIMLIAEVMLEYMSILINLTN